MIRTDILLSRLSRPLPRPLKAQCVEAILLNDMAEQREVRDAGAFFDLHRVVGY